MALTTEQRGYGWKHRKLVERYRPHAYGTPCARCGRVMYPGQPIQLDHNGDRTGYLGFSHERCNKRAGGRKGGKISARRRAIRRVLAREW